MPNPNLNVLRWKDLVAQHAQGTPFSVALLLALIEQESAGNPTATRFEGHYRWLYKAEEYAARLPKSLGLDYEVQGQKTSFGITQIMGAVAREYGFASHYFELLLVPDFNLTYGLQHLTRLHKRFPTFPDYVSAYNAGSPRKINGKYSNQSYVDSVLKKKLQWESVLETKLH